jgi:hypothetical protein
MDKQRKLRQAKSRNLRLWESMRIDCDSNLTRLLLGSWHDWSYILSNSLMIFLLKKDKKQMGVIVSYLRQLSKDCVVEVAQRHWVACKSQN